MHSKCQDSSASRKRDEHLSKDGKWRSFPKVPNLLQYISNGNYYARIKVNGKLIRESLRTDTWSKAKLRLTDFFKKHQQARGEIQAPTFAEVVERFKRELEADSGIKPQSKRYRLWCLQKLQKTWPKLWDQRLDSITETACKEWAAELHKSIACHYYNNTIGTLKQVFQVGLKLHKEHGGDPLGNPAAELHRVKIKQKDLRLPETSQFHSLVENLRKNSGGWGPRIGDLVEFMAYSGLLI